jgi:hypothetical protein
VVICAPEICVHDGRCARSRQLIKAASMRVHTPERWLNAAISMGSRALCENSIMKTNHKTLWVARRFGLVCLLGALTGIGFANFVQMSTRPAYSLRVDSALPCVFDTPQRCAISLPHGG